MSLVPCHQVTIELCWVVNLFRITLKCWATISSDDSSLKYCTPLLPTKTMSSIDISDDDQPTSVTTKFGFENIPLKHDPPSSRSLQKCSHSFHTASSITEFLNKDLPPIASASISRKAAGSFSNALPNCQLADLASTPLPLLKWVDGLYGCFALSKTNRSSRTMAGFWCCSRALPEQSWNLNNDYSRFRRGCPHEALQRRKRQMLGGVMVELSV